MKRIFAAILLSSLVLSGCSSGGDDGESNEGQFSGSCALKIINGDTCPNEKGPVALVRLLKNEELVGICTGTFLTPTHVLTAGHCFEVPGATAAEIWTGGTSVHSKSISIHPKFNLRNRISMYDVAIVELAEGVDAATLPLFLSEAAETGMRLNIAGFGVDENGHSAADTDPAQALKKGEMLISQISQGYIMALFDVTESGICSGDSGGPAIVLNKDGKPGVIGTANAVGGTSLIEVERCQNNTVSVFTNMQFDPVTDWIIENAPGTGVI